MTRPIPISGLVYGNYNLNNSQENAGLFPDHFTWEPRQPNLSDPLAFYLDQAMPQALDRPTQKNVGILWETRELRPWHYDWAINHSDAFYAILTHDISLCSTPPFRFFLMGGSFIRDWDIYPKSKLVSLITSEKTANSGHRYRHAIVQSLAEFMDVYGPPYTPYIYKAVALREYAFSITVEGSRSADLITEKIIDCFSQGTIPIYWGSPHLDRYFDERGILEFGDELGELADILSILDDKLYQQMLPFARTNLELAKEYRVTENWIYHHYPDLFT